MIFTLFDVDRLDVYIWEFLKAPPRPGSLWRELSNPNVFAQKLRMSSRDPGDQTLDVGLISLIAGAHHVDLKQQIFFMLWPFVQVTWWGQKSITKKKPVKSEINERNPSVLLKQSSGPNHSQQKLLYFLPAGSSGRNISR